MGRVLDPSYQFPKRSTAIHPWDTWIAGSQIWELECGVDFKCKPQSLITAGQKVALKRGLRLRSSIIDDYTVVLQFVERDEEYDRTWAHRRGPTGNAGRNPAGLRRGELPPIGSSNPGGAPIGGYGS